MHRQAAVVKRRLMYATCYSMIMSVMMNNAKKGASLLNHCDLDLTITVTNFWPDMLIQAANDGYSMPLITS